MLAGFYQPSEAFLFQLELSGKLLNSVLLGGKLLLGLFQLPVFVLTLLLEAGQELVLLFPFPGQFSGLSCHPGSAGLGLVQICLGLLLAGQQRFECLSLFLHPYCRATGVCKGFFFDFLFLFSLLAGQLGLHCLACRTEADLLPAIGLLERGLALFFLVHRFPGRGQFAVESVDFLLKRQLQFLLLLPLLDNGFFQGLFFGGRFPQRLDACLFSRGFLRNALFQSCFLLCLQLLERGCQGGDLRFQFLARGLGLLELFSGFPALLGLEACYLSGLCLQFSGQGLFLGPG